MEKSKSKKVISLLLYIFNISILLAVTFPFFLITFYGFDEFNSLTRISFITEIIGVMILLIECIYFLIKAIRIKGLPHKAVHVILM